MDNVHRFDRACIDLPNMTGIDQRAEWARYLIRSTVDAGEYVILFDDLGSRVGSRVLVSRKVIYLLSYHILLPSIVKILCENKRKNSFYLVLEFIAFAPTCSGHRN